MEENTEERDKLIYEIVIERYKLEWQRTNDLDSKASSIIGFAGVLATLTIGIIGLYPESSYRYLLFAPLTLFVLSVVFGLSAYWIMDFEAIDPEALIQKYKDKTKTEVLRTFVATTSEMTMLNYLFNQRKVKSVYRAFSMMMLAIVLFLIIPIVILII